MTHRLEIEFNNSLTNIFKLVNFIMAEGYEVENVCSGMEDVDFNNGLSFEIVDDGELILKIEGHIDVAYTLYEKIENIIKDNGLDVFLINQIIVDGNKVDKGELQCYFC